jgi:hypothetical protein
MLHRGALEDVYTFAQGRATFLADVISRRGIANLDDHPHWVLVDSLFSVRIFLHPAYVKILGALFLQHRRTYHPNPGVPSICLREYHMACDYDERSSCAKEHSDNMPNICLQECHMARYVWSELEYMQNAVLYNGYNDFSLYREDVEWALSDSYDTPQPATPTLPDVAEADALNHDMSSIHERHHEQRVGLEECVSEPDDAQRTVPRSNVFHSRSNTVWF